MTCIVSWIEKGNIYMGGDAGAGDGTIEVVLAHPKVFYKPRAKMLFGYTGSYRMAQLLEYELQIPKQTEKQDLAYIVRSIVPALRKCFKKGGFASVSHEVEEGGKFLIGYKSKVYELQGDYSALVNNSSYCSVGSGYVIATGALSALNHCTEFNPIDKLYLALEAAQKHLAYIRSPFTVMKIDATGKLVQTCRSDKNNG